MSEVRPRRELPGEPEQPTLFTSEEEITEASDSPESDNIIMFYEAITPSEQRLLLALSCVVGTLFVFMFMIRCPFYRWIDIIILSSIVLVVDLYAKAVLRIRKDRTAEEWHLEVQGQRTSASPNGA